MQLKVAPELISRRYRIDGQLGVGGMGIVYRALDRLTGNYVALKQVATPDGLNTTDSPNASVNARLALAQEFQFLAALRHPHIIPVMDYGFSADQRPFFTMTLLSNPSTILEAGQRAVFEQKIELLVQLLQALAYLHRRGILHRDLKPQNVLVTEGHVRVLDFGLSGPASRPTETSGTLAYMSPEVLLGEIPSAASDLYSFGLMAYEIFANTYPFDLKNFNRLIDQLLNQMPDLNLIAPVEVRDILRHLLVKDQHKRMADARQAIHAFGTLVNKEFSAETEEIRENILQSAPFTGRDTEFQQLVHALNVTSLHNQGDLWLIAGESGIGKSRLVEELRTQALVRGILSIRGQAISMGASPYHIWRDVVRWLALLTDLKDYEAGVLQMLVPDIETLLERDVPTVPDIEPRAARLRLFGVVEDIFARQTNPLLIILEDLHWESEESIDLLRWLTRGLSKIPVMIVSTFRDDEALALAEQLPSAHLLKLRRLVRSEIEQIAHTMMGDNQDPEVTELLERETEGNAFFIIEVLRALAEEVGEIDKIGLRTLPAQVFTGGIQTLIQRRLSHVPSYARPILDFAAISGRRIDTHLLKRANLIKDLDTWLANMVNVAVLDLQDGFYRFAHDKLRETILGELGEETKATLHQQVAKAIEQTYPNSPAYAAILAEHWSHTDNRAKVRHYSYLAGREALRNASYKTALRFLEQALAVANDSPKLEQARILRAMGETLLGLGHITESYNAFERVLNLLGYRVPATPRQNLRNLLMQFPKRAKRYFIPAHQVRDQEPIFEAASCWQRIGEVAYYRGDALMSIGCGVITLNLAESMPPSDLLVRSYANMAIVGAMLPAANIAERYIKRTEDTLSKIRDPRAEAFAKGRFCVYLTGNCHWDRATANAQRSIELAQQVGDYRQFNESTCLLALTHYCKGEFKRSVELFRQVQETAQRLEDVHYLVRGLMWGAQSTLRLGNITQAAGMLDKALEMITMHHDPIDQVRNLGVIGLLGLTRLYQNQPEVGLAFLDKIVGKTAPSFAVMETYAGDVETRLALWKDGPMPTTLQTPWARFKRYARIFPMMRARYQVYEGIIAHKLGKADQAQAVWKKAIQQAGSVKMPFEEAFAQYTAGLYLPLGDNQRRTYLEQAHATFNRLGALYHDQWAQAALEKR